MIVLSYVALLIGVMALIVLGAIFFPKIESRIFRNPSKK